MNADDAGAEIHNDLESSVLRIVSKGMHQAAEESTKKLGGELLTKVLPAAIAGQVAGPLAAAIAGIVGAMIDGVFKETSAVERKLNTVLANPFRTAQQTVRSVLEEEIRNDAEESFANRRLEAAHDRLDEAYVYAEAQSPQKCLLVQVYQCIVAALIESGGASMRRCISQFQKLAAEARDHAHKLRAEADNVHKRGPGVVTKALEIRQNVLRVVPGLPRQWREMGYVPAPNLQSDLDGILQAQEQSLLDSAAALERNAKDLDDFCSLANLLHENRQAILKSPKEKTRFTKLLQWLTAKTST